MLESSSGGFVQPVDQLVERLSELTSILGLRPQYRRDRTSYWLDHRLTWCSIGRLISKVPSKIGEVSEYQVIGLQDLKQGSGGKFNTPKRRISE